MAKDESSTDSSAPLMKWIGIATAVLSLGSAIYGALHAESDLRDRRRTVNEELATGRSQLSVGDYAAAWDSMQRASTTADADGVFAKLLGGLSKEQRTVLVAQQDLAMQWVRQAQAPEGHTFSEIADKVGGVLAAGANESTGERKADLLAHQGLAYFLKQRDGDSGVRPETLYKAGVAADPKNPYANAFWGLQIVWTNGPLAEAQERFTAALASNRARDVVRRFQLSAYADSHADDADVEWWRAVESMHEDGETIDEKDLVRMQDDYYRALTEPAYYTQLTMVVPPAEHLKLLEMLLKSRNLSESGKVTVLATKATLLEASDQKDVALVTWRELQAITRTNPNYTVSPRVDAAIKRLTHRPTK